MTNLIVGFIIGIAFFIYSAYVYTWGKQSVETEIEQSIINDNQFKLRGKLYFVQPQQREKNGTET